MLALQSNRNSTRAKASPNSRSNDRSKAVQWSSPPGSGRQGTLVQAFLFTIPLTSGGHSNTRWRKPQSPQQGSLRLSSDLVPEWQVQSGPAGTWAGQCLGGRAKETYGQDSSKPRMSYGQEGNGWHPSRSCSLSSLGSSEQGRFPWQESPNITGHLMVSV